MGVDKLWITILSNRCIIFNISQFFLSYMSKTIVSIVITLVIVALAIAAVFYFRAQQETAEVPLSEESDVLKELQIPTATNPAEEVPDVNPVKKTNPFEQTYQNPFE